LEVFRTKGETHRCRHRTSAGPVDRRARALGAATEQSPRDTLASANVKAEVIPAKTREDGLKMAEDGTVAAYFADRAILACLASKSKEADRKRTSFASPPTVCRSSPMRWRRRAATTISALRWTVR